LGQIGPWAGTTRGGVIDEAAGESQKQEAVEKGKWGDPRNEHGPKIGIRSGFANRLEGRPSGRDYYACATIRRPRTV
jgi:hypothetical protein